MSGLSRGVGRHCYRNTSGPIQDDETVFGASNAGYGFGLRYGRWFSHDVGLEMEGVVLESWLSMYK